MKVFSLQKIRKIFTFLLSEILNAVLWHLLSESQISEDLRSLRSLKMKMLMNMFTVKESNLNTIAPVTRKYSFSYVK